MKREKERARSETLTGYLSQLTVLHFSFPFFTTLTDGWTDAHERWGEYMLDLWMDAGD